MRLRTLHTVGEAGDERGMALITALLIMLLCTIVVAAVLGLATHTAQQSGLSRDRQASLSAAQAGIQADLSLIANANGACPTPSTGETPLPDQNLPTESYIIHASSSCTTGGPAVISATGYVPDATNPTATTTVVAHINRSDGAPVSGGSVPSGQAAYDFPDAIFSGGTLSASNFDLFGSGGAVPDITADGALSASGTQITGSVTGQTSVSLSSMSTVGGSVAAGSNLSLSNVTVTGTATYAGTYTAGGTVTIGGSTSTAPTSGYIAPLSRPMPDFSYSAADIGGLGVGSTPVTSCPSAWTASFYNFVGSCSISSAAGSYTPSAANGNTVIIAQGSLSVAIPPTAGGGQLYIVDMGGAGDSVTITGNGSTLPVFAITDGSINVSGTLVGQFVGHTVTATGTMTFTPPATPMPDLSFPPGYTAPTALTATGTNAYVSTVTLQYQCPGTTAC